MVCSNWCVSGFFLWKNRLPIECCLPTVINRWSVLTKCFASVDAPCIWGENWWAGLCVLLCSGESLLLCWETDKFPYVSQLWVAVQHSCTPSVHIFLNSTLVFKLFCWLDWVSACLCYLKMTVRKFFLLSVGNSQNILFLQILKSACSREKVGARSPSLKQIDIFQTVEFFI